jgi:hypothetical protein
MDMRKFNFVVVLMALVLANPVNASESKYEAKKHEEFSKLFVPESKDFTFKFSDLSNHKTSTSRDFPSPSSFQFKSESDFDWFGKNKHHSQESEHEHSFIADDDHEFRWNREHHGGNWHHGSGHHGDYDWDDSDHWGQGDIGDYCNVPTQPVPEPETYAMFLAGLFTIGALKRRKSAR